MSRPQTPSRLKSGTLGRSLVGSPSGCCLTPKTPGEPSWSGRARRQRVPIASPFLTLTTPRGPM
uniref:7 kd protein n=1 Tax=Rous sarcoma virus TaxID=11886 RepID=Q85731_9RETR|nr:7 kd protein [Rous sarcoma virus]